MHLKHYSEKGVISFIRSPEAQERLRLFCMYQNKSPMRAEIFVPPPTRQYPCSLEECVVYRITQ